MLECQEPKIMVTSKVKLLGKYFSLFSANQQKNFPALLDFQPFLSFWHYLGLVLGSATKLNSSRRVSNWIIPGLGRCNGGKKASYGDKTKLEGFFSLGEEKRNSGNKNFSFSPQWAEKRFLNAAKMHSGLSFNSENAASRLKLIQSN